MLLEPCMKKACPAVLDEPDKVGPFEKMDILAAFVVFMGVAYFYGLFLGLLSAGGATALQVGDTAPTVSLPATTAEHVSLAD